MEKKMIRSFSQIKDDETQNRDFGIHVEDGYYSELKAFNTVGQVYTFHVNRCCILSLFSFVLHYKMVKQFQTNLRETSLNQRRKICLKASSKEINLDKFLPTQW
jgi:hypothetical protein